MTERLKGWKTVILGLMAAGVMVSLVGCGETPQTPESVDTSIHSESASSQESSVSSQTADTLEESYAAAVDDGTFYAAIDDYYSDTHYTEVTVRLGRLDGEPVDDDYKPVGGLIEPAFESGLFDEVSTAKNGDRHWYEDGAYFIHYFVYTTPAHAQLSFCYTDVDWTPTELNLSFTPQPVPCKTAGEMKFDGGMILDSVMTAERSGIAIFYLPEEQAVTYETDENGEVTGSHLGAVSVQLSILDGDGGVLCEKEGRVGSSGNDREGYCRYAYHFFFDENDPLPVDEVSTLVLNGNEIPLTEYPE